MNDNAPKNKYKLSHKKYRSVITAMCATLRNPKGNKNTEMRGANQNAKRSSPTQIVRKQEEEIIPNDLIEEEKRKQRNHEVGETNEAEQNKKNESEDISKNENTQTQKKQINNRLQIKQSKNEKEKQEEHQNEQRKKKQEEHQNEQRKKNNRLEEIRKLERKLMEEKEKLLEKKNKNIENLNKSGKEDNVSLTRFNDKRHQKKSKDDRKLDEKQNERNRPSEIQSKEPTKVENTNKKTEVRKRKLTNIVDPGKKLKLS